MMHAMRVDKPLALGQTCLGHTNLYLWTAPIVHQDCRGSSKRKDVRSPFHSERDRPVELAAWTAHERTEDNVHEDWAHDLPRQRFFPPLRAA